MKKSYYCVFGTHRAVPEVAELLRQHFDMEFVPHDSSYFGQYLLYSGLYADKLTISENKPDTGSTYSANRQDEYPVLLHLSNNEGKNSDKLSKTTFLKRQFSAIPDIALLDEKIYEETS